MDILRSKKNYVIKNKAYNVGIYDEFWSSFVICMIAQLSEWVKGHSGSIHGSEHKLSSFSMSSGGRPYKHGPSLRQQRRRMNA